MNEFNTDQPIEEENIILQALEGNNMTGLFDLSQLNQPVVDQAMNMLGSIVDYKDLLMRYSCAIKEIRTKFDVLNTEFNTRYKRNPISNIQTRLKSNASIMEKLARKEVPFSINNINEQLNDIAGIRVICSYQDDIYRLADALASQDDITVISRKDYIKNPKPNGYRSLHMIVSVPVFFADRVMEMKAEVQIRTIAMDFWASLEHQIKYKRDIPKQDKVAYRLKICADAIAETDLEMMSIRSELEKLENEPSKEEIILERLSHFDEPIL